MQKLQRDGAPGDRVACAKDGTERALTELTLDDVAVDLSRLGHADTLSQGGDARRQKPMRRIAKRGSDRITLITGPQASGA